MFHDKLEDEKRRYKSDLNEISSAFDKALKKRVQWEREASNLKGELNNIRRRMLNSNGNVGRRRMMQQVRFLRTNTNNSILGVRY